MMATLCSKGDLCSYKIHNNFHHTASCVKFVHNWNPQRLFENPSKDDGTVFDGWRWGGNAHFSSRHVQMPWLPMHLCLSCINAPLTRLVLYKPLWIFYRFSSAQESSKTNTVQVTYSFSHMWLRGNIDHSWHTKKLKYRNWLKWQLKSFNGESMIVSYL